MKGHWDAGEDRLDAGERRRLEWLAALLAALLRGLGATWRVAEDRAALAAARATSPSGALIYVFWHNRMLMLSYTHRGRGIQVLRSGSRDGQLIAAVNRRLGYGMPAGSGSRGGAAGLRRLLQGLRAGHDVALTVDGPRGPRGHLHAGALQLAALSGCPVVPVAVASRRLRAFASWDRTLLPWPGQRLVLRYGEAELLPRELDGPALECARRALQERLRRFTDALDGELGRPVIPPAPEA
ncbi:DUF374 domain-containing protein [bacterium]|nr:DUF374 domain-containing protein [bacterium]